MCHVSLVSLYLFNIHLVNLYLFNLLAPLSSGIVVGVYIAITTDALLDY